MARLIQLPDGQWIDPDAILEINALPYATAILGHENDQRRPGVILTLDHGGNRVICCTSMDEARSVRDTIAERVNASGPD